MDRFGRIFAAIAAVFVWAVLLTELVLAVTAPQDGLGAAAALGRYVSSFTILANLFAAVALAAVAFDPHRAARANILTAILLYLTVVALVYLLEFHGALETKAGGLRMLLDAAIHDIVPALYLVFWLFLPKGTLGWRAPFAWLAFPLAYLVFMLVQGALTGHYAYPFLDLAALGAGRVAINSLGLLGIYLVVGFVLACIDCALGGLPRRLPAASG